jgi:hypothetical protein
MSIKRVSRKYETDLPATPEIVFPLLCPVREYDWIREWRCEIVYSRNGFAELGCVFTTDFGDSNGQETWVVSHYDPNTKIAFIRTGLVRTVRYEVLLKPHENGSTILWHQEVTSLNTRGDELLEQYTEDAFRATMEPLNKMLAHYLQTGEPHHLD